MDATLKEVLIYIGLAALGAFILYLIVKSIIESIKREQFRKRNRETQFSGSAVKEEKGFWASLFTPKYSSRAEAIGDYGEKRVSSFLEDLDCEDYRVYNDLLIRYGNYTTQVDHIVISRYGVFVIETKNVHGKVYGGGNAEFWKQSPGECRIVRVINICKKTLKRFCTKGKYPYICTSRTRQAS